VKPWIPAFAGMTAGGFRSVSSDRRFCRTSSLNNVISPQRHPRECGDPETSERCLGEALDSRVRGNDGGWVSLRLFSSSLLQNVVSPQRRLSTMSSLHYVISPQGHPREGGDPETSERCLGEVLDSRVRGNDGGWVSSRLFRSSILQNVVFPQRRLSTTSSPRTRGSRDFSVMLRLQRHASMRTPCIRPAAQSRPCETAVSRSLRSHASAVDLSQAPARTRVNRDTVRKTSGKPPHMTVAVRRNRGMDSRLMAVTQCAHALSSV